MELDPVTGLDPPGVKVRAAQGLESVDFFVQVSCLFFLAACMMQQPFAVMMCCCVCGLCAGLGSELHYAQLDHSDGSSAFVAVQRALHNHSQTLGWLLRMLNRC